MNAARIYLYIEAILAIKIKKLRKLDGRKYVEQDDRAL
jgi:hypothetical protein